MNDENQTFEKSITPSFAAAARPIVTVDVEKYQAWLDDPRLTPEQKEEFLQALWSVVVTFVEIGFGVHPLQEVCGQIEDESNPGLKEIFDAVESKSSEERVETDFPSPNGGLEVQ
ncbi:hypothetical protein [Amaricoccus solimangrovi]|uniref:Uncharacterized protein n=1 Tax=Amaricoccus solimangrovi TaxID=2589815 RepID=A0A501WMP6_9RHOB|nr:hypothetical protein [Amaricoccus solimangrovi]TPE48557.1 hypothetical protein FJM51_17595 [Amaricoccus solimangrovi]